MCFFFFFLFCMAQQIPHNTVIIPPRSFTPWGLHFLLHLECHIQISVNKYRLCWLAQPVTMATAQPPSLRHPPYLRLPRGFFHRRQRKHYIGSREPAGRAPWGEGWWLNVDRQPEMRWEWNGAKESKPEDARWGMTKGRASGEKACVEERKENCWIEKVRWWWNEGKEAIPHLPSS